MKDLQADWKKWSRAEQISALIGFPFLVILAPALAASAVLIH
jgi:hypothetical protein